MMDIDKSKVHQLLQTQAMQKIAIMPKDRRLKLVRMLSRQIASRAVDSLQLKHK